MARSTIIFLCLVPVYLFGQEKFSDSLKTPANFHKIEYMSRYMTLKLTQSSDIETFTVLNPDNDIRLSPNAQSNSSISFNYQFISFSIKFVPRFLPGNNDDDKKGKTKSGGLGLNLNFKHWLQELSYSRTRGYYLENTSDYQPDWTPGDPYVQFPDFVFSSYQGVTAYNFNHQFSVNALTTQTERQLKSAGSFIPHLSYRYYITDDRSPLLPGSSKQKANTIELIAGAGYYYNLVVNKTFYFSAGLTPGAGYSFSKLTTRQSSGNAVSHQKNIIVRLDGRAGLGYNGRRFFTGAYMKLSDSFYNQEHTNATTENARVGLQIFAGYRLNAPKWLKQQVEAIHDLMGIW